MSATVWRASRPRRPRTLCGLFALAERFAWPIVTRCATCLTAEAVLA